MVCFAWWGGVVIKTGESTSFSSKSSSLPKTLMCIHVHVGLVSFGLCVVEGVGG